MPPKLYKVGGKASTGHTIAEILGQSPVACVFTTTDRQLRWVYYGNDGKLPEKLGATVARFDRLMREIGALKVTKGVKDELYILLGKSLFFALNSGRPKTLASVFDEVEALISSQIRTSSTPNAEFDTRPVFDVAIICALQDPELSAVLKLANWSKIQSREGDPQTYYSSLWKTKNHQEIRAVAAAPNYMGLVAAGVLAAKMIWQFRPKLVSIVGIAAGAKSGKQGFGDILAANQTFDYGSSKTTVANGVIEILPNPNPLQIAAKLQGRLNEWQRERTGLDAIFKSWPAKKPQTLLQLHMGPLFSSPTVLDASQPVKEVTRHWRKLIGVEMEAHAVHRACHDTIEPEPMFLCLKSICDFAQAKNDDWQHFAAFTSAQLLYKFLIAEWPTLSGRAQ